MVTTSCGQAKRPCPELREVAVRRTSCRQADECCADACTAHLEWMLSIAVMLLRRQLGVSAEVAWRMGVGRLLVASSFVFESSSPLTSPELCSAHGPAVSFIDLPELCSAHGPAVSQCRSVKRCSNGGGRQISVADVGITHGTRKRSHRRNLTIAGPPCSTLDVRKHTGRTRCGLVQWSCVRLAPRRNSRAATVRKSLG